MRNRLFRYVLAVALCCLSFEPSNTGFANPAAPDLGGQLTKLQARVGELERRIGKAEDFIALNSMLTKAVLSQRLAMQCRRLGSFYCALRSFP